jgi:outer membrane receptor protein involved in Fe transport
VVTIDDSPRGVYRTNGNGDYADVRGVEFSLRKQPMRRGWGTTWGYANFTTQIGINGRSGAPILISKTQEIYGASGDAIVHNNPRLKAGVYYETPADWDFLAGIFKRLSVSVDYSATFPNELLFGDYFEFQGQKYMRPVDQNTNLRVRKDITFNQDKVRIGLYLEVRNLFNNKWLNMGIFDAATPADQQKFVESNFQSLPSVDRSGVPILELAMYRNLPRMIIIGANLEL